MLYVGGGVGMAQAVPALRAFIATTQMPATCTLKGLGAVEADYPYYLGMLGMHGTESGKPGGAGMRLAYRRRRTF